ncbi:MAG TPA: TlpA disulfide reductase family protein, partial [Thermodesulfobacteriota bacterium]
LLNFWATWCPPCRAEMPSMERAYQQYRERGFTIVAIDYREGPELVEPFVKELGLTFPIALDRDGAVTDAKYPTSGLPTTYLIDRQGRAVARRMGYVEWDGAAARALIETLLDEPAAPSKAGSERPAR